MLAIALLTFTELALSLTNEFSGNIGVMQSANKYPNQIGSISAHAPDLDGAVRDVVNVNPGYWLSYLQSLPLRLQGFTPESAVNDLLDSDNSPLVWIIIGLVSWQIIWRQTGSPEIKN